MQDGGNLKMLAGRCRSGQNKNPGADDCADTKRRQRPRTERLLQPVLRVFRISDELVDRFFGE